MSTATLSNELAFLTIKQEAPAFSFYFRVHSGSEKQLHDTGHIRSKCHEVIKEAGLETSLTETLLSQVDKKIEELDLSTGARSIGIFVTGANAYIQSYYTYLPERQYAGEYFSLLESLYATQQSIPYALFLFEPRSVQVFKGQGEHLQILESSSVEHLSKIYKQRDSAHFDKDGKAKRGEPDKKWVKELLDAMSAVCCEQKLPAVIVGNSLLGASADDLKKSSLNIIGIIEDVVHATGGNYQSELGSRIVELANKNKSEEWLQKCNESASCHKVSTSIEEMLACAKEGRAAQLLLETPCWEKSGRVEFTPLHEIARETLAKHGNLEFLAKNSLDKWNGQVMLLRY